MGSSENITGNGGRGTSSFILRRQDAVEFTAEASLEFSPDLKNPTVENEEAGVTLFIQRMQHFDLGVIVKRNPTTKALQKFIQLRRVTFHSSPNGLSDAYSRPGSFSLSDDVTSLRLRVQAVHASTYAFSYVEMKDGKNVNERWTIVGYGNATEVSGGFTGVSLIRTRCEAIGSWHVRRLSSECTPQVTVIIQPHRPSLVGLRMTPCAVFCEPISWETWPR